MTAKWKLELRRRIVAFVIAALVMVILGSAAHSYFVQEAWSAAAGRAAGTGPASLRLGDRMTWAFHDVVGMLRSYAATTSIALLLAFLGAGALARITAYRVCIFGMAGAVAIFVLFAALKIFLGTVGIFGARGPVGLAAQMAVGLLAGLVFALLTRAPTSAAVVRSSNRQ